MVSYIEYRSKDEVRRERCRIELIIRVERGRDKDVVGMWLSRVKDFRLGCIGYSVVLLVVLLVRILLNDNDIILRKMIFKWEN